MSISTLTDEKVARNAQRAASPAQAAPTQSVANPDQAGVVAAAPSDDSKKTISDAISAVAAYIPTEIIAAYTILLALGASDSGHGALPLPWFLGMLAFTPLFVWLVYAVRSKEENRNFLSPRLWPWWESIAACIAFTVWSAALPNSAFGCWGWYSPRLAALALMLVSGLLPLIGSLVTTSRQRP